MTKFFVAHNGVFEEYSDELFDAVIKVEFPFIFSKEEDTFETVYGDVEQKISPKFERMPLSVFQEALAFLEWCYEEKKTEGFVAHRYIDGKWENAVFPQWNSGTSCCYHPELDLAKATRVMGDTHSHPPRKHGHGASFHSGTDGLDERKNNGIFVVVTGFNPMDCDPDIWGCIRGIRFRLPKAEMLFDITKYEKNPSFPEEWKTRVGSLPCKGCERKRDQDRIDKEHGDKTKKYEEEKRFRLVPKPVLEAWRTEVAKEKETMGKTVKRAYEEFRRRTNYTGRFLRCNNHDCGKVPYSVDCIECKKALYSDIIIDSLVDMLDEVEAVVTTPEEVKLLTAVIEDDLKVRVIVPPPATASQASGTQKTIAQSPPVPGTVIAGAPHIILVHSDNPCDEKCNYAALPHKHLESREKLLDHFKVMINEKAYLNCEAQDKKCPYQDLNICENGCVKWLETLDRKEPENSLPKCSSDSCKIGGHSYSTCEIRMRLVAANQQCPDKECEVRGHIWAACAYRQLRAALKLAGAFHEPAASRDDDTKRYVRCVNPLCADAGHKFASCSQSYGISKTSAAAEEAAQIVIVGDDGVCDEGCHLRGSSHSHKPEPGALPPGATDTVHDFYPEIGT